LRIYCFATLLCGPALLAQFNPGSLEASLSALNCHTVLLAPKETVVDPIHWSPDSKSLAFKLNGTWLRCDLDQLQLKRYKWRNNQDVAGPRVQAIYPPMAAAELKEWASCSQEESRGVKVLGGPALQLLQQDGGSVTFRITFQDGKVTDLWTTNQEDCQALCLSPDQKWVAFLCSTHGVAVMKVPFAPAPLVNRGLAPVPAAPPKAKQVP
jgi:hypothetical protein